MSNKKRCARRLGAFILQILKRELEGLGRTALVHARGKELGLAVQAYANAEVAIVRVGGWGCLGDTRPERALWFSGN